MNFTYLPMGSMQLGPNGELIPTSIPSSLSAGRVQPTYHAVAAAPPNGSTQNWKMTDLAPLYTTSHGHSFAVMDPLTSGHATMVPMAVAGHFDANGQFVQQLQPQPVAIPVAQTQLPKDDDKNKQVQQLQTMVQVKEEQNLHTLQPPKQQPQLTTLQNATRYKPFQILQDQHVQHGGQHGQTVQYQHVQLQQPQHLVTPTQLGVGTIVQAQPIQAQPGQAQQVHLAHTQDNTQQHHHPQQQPQPQPQPQQQDQAQQQTPQKESVGYTIVSNPSNSENSHLANDGNESAIVARGDVASPQPDEKGSKKSDKKYACDFCDGKDFRSRGNLKRHQKDFHLSVGSDKVTFHCDVCKKDFQNRFNLRRHRLGVHGALEQNAKTYPCDICMKTFHYTDNLKRHKRNVHGVDVIGGEDGEGVGDEAESSIDVKPDPNAPVNTSFICDICNKNMQSSYNLKRHKVAVHKDTRILYGCDECDKNFTSITNYRRHKVMIHGPGKQAYKCDSCDKVLASKDGLRRHVESIHEGLEKNYGCDICGSKFLRKEYLDKHRKTHEFNYAILPADSTTMAPQILPVTTPAGLL